MAHIEKRGDRWRARYRQPGGKERSKTFDRKIDAQRFVSGMEASIFDNTYVDPHRGKITLKEWSTVWEASLGGLRPSTRSRDLSYLRTHILPTFGSRGIGSIDRSEVEEWVAELNTRRKPATVRLAHGVFLRVMQMAVDKGRVQSNPCVRVRLLPVDNEEMKFLLPTQVACLAESIDPRYRAFVLVMVYGGLRPGEMAALRPAQVDLVAGRVEVIANVSEVDGKLEWGPPKTRHGRRSVNLPVEVVAELAQHMAKWPGDETVFSAPRGGVLRATAWRRRFWQPAVDKAGLAPLRPYALRHTAISFWIEAEGNLLAISRRAGHSNVAFTLNQYGHVFPDADAALSGRLSNLYIVPKTDADREMDEAENPPRPHRGLRVQRWSVSDTRNAR
jgi:integrase